MTLPNIYGARVSVAPRVVPTISPNKTWAGLLGGCGNYDTAAWLLAPLLTPISALHALLAGLVISVAGFFGGYLHLGRQA